MFYTSQLSPNNITSFVRALLPSLTSAFSYRFRRTRIWVGRVTRRPTDFWDEFLYQAQWIPPMKMKLRGLHIWRPREICRHSHIHTVPVIIFGYMVFLAIFRLYGLWKTFSLIWKFGNMVILAKWSILAGQNRGPYIRNRGYVQLVMLPYHWK